MPGLVIGVAIIRVFFGLQAGGTQAPSGEGQQSSHSMQGKFLLQCWCAPCLQSDPKRSLSTTERPTTIVHSLRNHVCNFLGKNLGQCSFDFPQKAEQADGVREKDVITMVLT